MIQGGTKQERVFLVGTCIMGFIMSMLCAIINAWIDERWFWCFILTLLALVGLDIVYRKDLNKVGIISGSVTIGILLVLMLTEKVYRQNNYDLYTKIGLFGLPYVLLGYNVGKGVLALKNEIKLPNLPLYETILLLYEVFCLTVVITNYGEGMIFLFLVPLSYGAYHLQQKKHSTAAILCMISGVLSWVLGWCSYGYIEETILLLVGMFVVGTRTFIALVLQAKTVNEVKDDVQEILSSAKTIAQNTFNKENGKNIVIQAMTIDKVERDPLRKLLFGLECTILVFWIINYIIFFGLGVPGKMISLILMVLYGMYIFRVGKGKLERFYQSNKIYLVNICICLVFIAIQGIYIYTTLILNISFQVLVFAYLLVNLGKVISHIFKTVLVENSQGSTLCILCGTIALLSNFLPWYVVDGRFYISIFDALKTLLDYNLSTILVVMIAFIISLVVSIVIAMVKSKGARIIIGAINFLGAFIIVFGMKSIVVEYASKPTGILGEITGGIAGYAMDNYTAIGIGGYVLIIATLAYLGIAMMQKNGMSTSVWQIAKQAHIVTAQVEPIQVIKVRCIKCGTLLDETAKFCIQCGHAMYEDSH